MIRVTCDACGAGFNARDELAGRKGKCPKCQAPIVVPAADGPARPTAPAPAPAPAPAVSSGGRRGGGASRRRGGSRKKGGGVGVVVVVAVVLGLAFAAYKMSTAEDPGAAHYQAGMSAMQLAQYDEAIARFEQIPAESQFHAAAQEQLDEARSIRDVKAADAKVQGANKLDKVIQSFEANYVLRDGPDHPDYAPNARYLLKRAAEFVERFPDHERSATYRQYGYKYEKVASLDRPPTPEDVMAEMRMRTILVAPDFPAAGAAIDEYARAPGADPDEVRRMTDWLQAHSLEWWSRLKDELRVSKRALEPGQENWQAIANTTNKYLRAIEQVPGLTPSMEARSLYNQATNGGG